MFYINAENPEKALEYLAKADSGSENKAYILYLYSLVSNLKEDREETFAYLKKSIEADEYYKVVAYNDPDYATLLEDEEFLEIVQ